MSVLIKDMKMPTGCASCKLKRRNGGRMVCPLCDEEWDIHDPMAADFRLQNCPLFPVPDHGRLGDLDALCDRLEKAADTTRYKELSHGLTAAFSLVNVTPTIIPASGGEQG